MGVRDGDGAPQTDDSVRNESDYIEVTMDDEEANAGVSPIPLSSSNTPNQSTDEATDGDAGKLHDVTPEISIPRPVRVPSSSFLSLPSEEEQLAWAMEQSAQASPPPSPPPGRAAEAAELAPAVSTRPGSAGDESDLPTKADLSYEEHYWHVDLRTTPGWT